MVKIAGKYQLIKNENFVEYLKSLGLPEDKAVQGDALKPILSVVVNGKQISFSTDVAVDKTSPTFTLDQEVDEETPFGALKSTAKLSDDTLTITSTSKDGKNGKRVYKFSDTDLVLTLSSTDAKVPAAKRYYKRV